MGKLDLQTSESFSNVLAETFESFATQILKLRHEKDKKQSTNTIKFEKF